MIVATSVTSAQPRDRDRLADRRRGREIDPVPVRGLEQLGALVLGGRVEPEAARRRGRNGARLRAIRPCARR